MEKHLKEYRITFEKVPEGQKAVPDPYKLGVRSKLGGKPDWDQDGENPKCPECNERMSFIAQIDSMEHNESYNPHRVDWLTDEQQFMFGDAGMIYIFMCFDCLETKSTMQCG